jgi:hypothetical protein
MARFSVCKATELYRPEYSFFFCSPDVAYLEIMLVRCVIIPVQPAISRCIPAFSDLHTLRKSRKISKNKITCPNLDSEAREGVKKMIRTRKRTKRLTRLRGIPNGLKLDIHISTLEHLRACMSATVGSLVSGFSLSLDPITYNI